MLSLRLYTLRLGVWEELFCNGLTAKLKLVVNVRTILPISPLLPTGRKAWQSWIGICSECQKDNCTCSTLQYSNILISTLLLTFRWRNVNQISAFECKIIFATYSSGVMHCLARREGLPLLILLDEMESSGGGGSWIFWCFVLTNKRLGGGLHADTPPCHLGICIAHLRINICTLSIWIDVNVINDYSWSRWIYFRIIFCDEEEAHCLKDTLQCFRQSWLHELGK